MSDILRHTAGLIERFGHFRIRDKGARAEIELFMQFDDGGEAAEFAVRNRRRVYKFNDSWVVFLRGNRMFLLLAAGRDYMCPAHKRLVTLAVQIHAINAKRLLMGGLQIKGKRPRAFKAACREKNVELAGVRGRLFEEMRKEYSALPNVCPEWAALGPPIQRRLRDWWAENKPVENAAYWKQKAC